MYTVKCDGYPLLDFRDENLMIINPKVRVEVNKVGDASFTIYKNHPYYAKLKMKKSVFEVADEIGAIFRGRMTEHTKDFNNGKAVDLEGAMAFFNDSVVPPYNFPDDFVDDDEYLGEVTEDGNVVRFFLKWLLENHNSQVNDFQKFKLGVVTVADPNNYITRSNKKCVNTWETLKSKLFESVLGGKLCIRYEEDGNYIDYLSEFTLTNTQSIKFGKNLLDLKQNSDAKNTYSAVIPIGKDGLMLSTIPDGVVSEDIYKITLENGLHVVYSKKALDEYGWICAPVKDTTWDDVTEEQNLLTKGINWIVAQGMMLSDTIEITAADLHYQDKEIRSFRIYRKINVDSSQHNLTSSFDLTKLDIDVLRPQNTKITVGKTKLTLSAQNSKDKADTIKRIENAEKDIGENKDSITETKEQILEQSTTILNNCEQILMSALESYTETGDFEKYKQTVESQLQLLADQMNLKFTETIQQILDVDGDLQEKFNTITKYFTFDINGLTIGQIDSPFKVIIDNDIYRMTVNGVDALYLDPDGLSTIPEFRVTKKFVLFDCIIEQDEHGNINC